MLLPKHVKPTDCIFSICCSCCVKCKALSAVSRIHWAHIELWLTGEAKNAICSTQTVFALLDSKPRMTVASLGYEFVNISLFMNTYFFVHSLKYKVKWSEYMHWKYIQLQKKRCLNIWILISHQCMHHYHINVSFFLNYYKPVWRYLFLKVLSSKSFSHQNHNQKFHFLGCLFSWI